MDRLEIETAAAELAGKPFDPETFLYDLMAAYDAPETTIAKMRSKTTGKSDVGRARIWAGKLHYAYRIDCTPKDLLAELKASKKSRKLPFLIATDGRELVVEDTKAGETTTLLITDLSDSENAAILLPLAGIQPYKVVEERLVDFKATKQLAKLHDALVRETPEWGTPERSHQMNQFMTRVIFCFFAEDTGIFHENIFTEMLVNYGGRDGEQVTDLLSAMFGAMNTPLAQRAGMLAHLASLPYVNGGLFSGPTEVPPFCAIAWRRLREAGELKWQEINPDIFGSMIQAITSAEKRHELGMHYTSETNIRKVLDPLFLDELREELEAAKTLKALAALQQRLRRIRVFDPACGSGNFLVIAYKELRRLERDILVKMMAISGTQQKVLMSDVRLQNFYGIEIDDFAAETAKLSLWIAEYQMNRELEQAFGVLPSILPLQDAAHVVCGNALRLDWEEVCPPGAESETYIAGNPPFLGFGGRDGSQQSDMAHVFKGHIANFKLLDFVAGWFCKAARSVGQDRFREAAFVSTSSVNQGYSAATLWPHLKEMGIEISFGHHPFRWANGAGDIAAVSCVIIGIRRPSTKPQKVFSGNAVRTVKALSPLLIESSVYSISKSRIPLSPLPSMLLGNVPKDGGHLIMSPKDAMALVTRHPEAQQIVRPLIGSNEFIKGLDRFCLWIEDSRLPMALSIPEIGSRIEAVRTTRLASPDEGANKLATTPHRFREMNQSSSHTIIIPSVSSEAREFLPVGILTADAVVSNLAFAMYDAPYWCMSLIASKLHRAWVGTVCGKLEDRLRYSNTLGWNTFPVPPLTDQDKADLDATADGILAARDAHPTKTIADLYDPKKMPENLREAHRINDEVLEKIYIGRTFKNDTERLEHLFARYAEMIAAEKEAKA